MGKIYIESRANEWREERWWWWWPVRGGIFCRPDSLCRVHPLQQPSVPRHGSFHESSPPAHTSRRSVGTLWVRQSLPHWIARAGTGGERDLFPFSRRFVVVGNPVARRLPRFRANFGEGDTALSIFFCRYSFFIEKLKSGGSILRDVVFSLSFPFSFSFFGKWIVLCSLVGIVGISSCSLRWKSVDARLYSRVCLGLSIKRIERDTFSGSE